MNERELKNFIINAKNLTKKITKSKESCKNFLIKIGTHDTNGKIKKGYK